MPQTKSKLEVPQFASSESEFFDSAQELTKKWESQRYKHIKRPYESHLIVSKRGALKSTYTSNLLSHKLWKILKTKQKAGGSSPIISFTVVNAIQAVHCSKYLDVVVVSSYSTAVNGPLDTPPCPHVNSYYIDSVPKKVEEIFRCLEFHDRKQREIHGVPKLIQYHQPKDYQSDFLAPIIVEIDSQHGGITTTMKNVRGVVEKGAAGIIINDQAPTAENINNFAKVIVPISEFINRLISTRVQLDIMDCDQVVYAKSFSRGALLISSNIDLRDQQFILGATVNLTKLSSVLQVAIENGAGHKYIEEIENKWLMDAKLLTYNEAVINEIKRLGGVTAPLLLNDWINKSSDLTLDDQMLLAKSYGVNIFWDAELPRSSLGCYRYKASLEAMISRASYIREYADVIVFESPFFDIGEVEEFSKNAKSLDPEIVLGYYVPPFVDWDSINIGDDVLSSFHEKLFDFGYIHHHFETAGLEAQALISELFSSDYSKRGLFAYIEGVQRPESYHQIQTNYHHYWSGAEYINRINRLAVDRKNFKHGIEEKSNENTDSKEK